MLNCRKLQNVLLIVIDQNKHFSKFFMPWNYQNLNFCLSGVRHFWFRALYKWKNPIFQKFKILSLLKLCESLPPVFLCFCVGSFRQWMGQWGNALMELKLCMITTEILERFWTGENKSYLMVCWFLLHLF